MQRMNTKFLILVITFSAVAVGGVGLVWGYSVMTDPVRHVERGRELEKAGDYVGAYRAFGRAVAKRRSNIEYLDLMRGALLKIVPPTIEEARQLYQMNLTILQQLAAVNPSDPEPWRQLLEAYGDRAQFLQAPPGWQWLADGATEMLKSVPKGSDAERLALRELGFALAYRDAQSTEAERTRAEEALRQVLAADSKDERAWDALLILLLNDTNRQFLANQQLSAEQRQKQFDEALAQAQTALPDSTAVALAKARFIRSQLVRGEIAPATALQAIDPVLDALERNSMLPSAPSAAVISTVDQLLATSRVEDAHRAVAIIDHWLSLYPDDLVMRRLQSIALRGYDADRSVAVARRIIDSDLMPVSMQMAFRDELRGDSAERILDVEIARAAQATDDATKKQHVQSAEKMRDLLSELGQGRADNARLLKAEAKLALLAGDAVTASAKLDRVIAVLPSPDAETYLFAAEAAARRNELGAALGYVNRGIERLGPSYQMMLMRAQLELGLRRGQAALATTKALLGAKPDDPTVIQMHEAAVKLTEMMSPEGTSDPFVRDLQESERLLAKRDLEGARTLLDRLHKTHPGDARVLTQLARLEMSSGNLERAVEHLDAALALAPNDQFIAQLRAIAGTTDPVARVDKLVELSVADEKLRPAARYALLMSVIATLRRDIAEGGRTNDGRFRDLDELKSSLAKLEAEVPGAREAATAAGPATQAVFGARFDEAVLAGDLRKAEQIGVEAEQSGDRALGAFLQARALLLQGKGEPAMALLERARQQGINSAEIARELGGAREQLGKVTEALAAYKEAYERRPGDLATLRAYSELLKRTGDAPKSLQLYRDAAQAAAGDRAIINAWLRMEEAVGDRSLALCWRRRVYRELPSERENALALAVMLTDGQADPRLIIDAECRVRFAESEWVALSPARRFQEIQAMLKANQAEGGEIFRSMLLARADDMETAVLQARAMRRAGRMADGETLLRAVLSKTPAGQTGPAWFAIGQYLEENGKTAAALEAFAEAQKVQNPIRREADLTISNFWFERGQWEQAFETMKSLIDGLAKPDARHLRRGSELAIKLRRFDAADAYLKQTMQAEGTATMDAVAEMLSANILHGRGEDLWAAGDKAAAQAQFTKAEEALNRAAQLQPGNALPWLSLASLHHDLYLRTRDAKLLDQALSEADRGTSMSNAFWPGIRLRKDILLEKGDTVGATQVIERFLSNSADNPEARKQLAELYLRAGLAPRAMTVLAEGAALNPNDAGWQMAMGELQMQRGQFAEAVAAFDRGLALSPGAATLAKAIESRQRSSPPDWRGIVELARQHSDEVRGSGAMRSALGASLANTGERESGLQSLRDTGRFIMDEIAAQRMRPLEIDSWYTALRQVFPPQRTAELDAFVRATFGDKLTPADQRWLAALWVETGPDGTSRAKEYLDQARAAMEQQDELYRSRVWLVTGNLAYLNGDCPGAIAAYENVVKEDATNTVALNNLGYLLAECLKEHKRAIEYARMAVKASPNQPEFLDTLGFALVLNGECAEARSVLERAIRLLPTAGSYIHLAEAFKCEGRKEDARTALDNAVTSNPTPEQQAEIAALRSTLN